ncbi:MAG: HEAT repeat domain-containing protein [Planctomycetota bacterium]
MKLARSFPSACLALALLLGGAAPQAAAQDPTPKDAAERGVREAERLLKRPGPWAPELVQALDEVLDAHDAALDAGGPGLSGLQRAVHAFVLDALVTERTTSGSKANLRLPVQLAAARALGRLDVSRIHAFLPTVERLLFDEGGAEVPPAVYEAVFHAVARDMGDEGARWLIERAVHPDATEKRTARAHAALRELGDTAERLPGPLRQAAIDRFIDVFQSYEYHWVDKMEAVAGFRGGSIRFRQAASNNRPYWLQLRPVLFETMRRLGTDARSGEVPRTPEGEELATIADWGNWNLRRRITTGAPWLPAEGDDGTRRLADVADRPVRPFADIWVRQYGEPWTGEYARTRADLELPLDVQGLALPARARLAATWLPAWREAWAEDPAPEVRAAALAAYGREGNPAARTRLLAALLGDPSPRVREAAALALVGLPPEPGIVIALRRVLGDAGRPLRERSYALLALGAQGDTETLTALLRAPLPRSRAEARVSEDLRVMALRALAALPGDDATADLEDVVREVLVDRDAPLALRVAAGCTLAELGSARSRGVVAALLEEAAEERLDPSLSIAVLAAAPRTLADDPEAAARIERVAARRRTPFAGVRIAAAAALAELGGPAAEAALVRLWHDLSEDTSQVVAWGPALMALARSTGDAARTTFQVARSDIDHELDRGALLMAAARRGLVANLEIEEVRAIRDARFELIGPGLLMLAWLRDSRGPMIQRAALDREAAGDVIVHAAWADVVRDPATATAGLLDAWQRARGPDERDAISQAWRHAPSEEGITFLAGIARSSRARADVRAQAVLTLARMAWPDVRDPWSKWAEHVVPYVHVPAWTAVARWREAAFLE